MAKNINNFIKENRRDVRNIDSSFVSISSQSGSNLTFNKNSFVVRTSVNVYTRSLDNALISGHPNGDKHGSGNGISGDDRNDWTLVASENSKNFLKTGRENIADGLIGKSGEYLNQLAFGTDSTPVDISDTSLKSESLRNFLWSGEGNQSNKTIANSYLLFHEHNENSYKEFGIYNNNNELYNRATTDSVTPSLEEELRVEIEYTIFGDTVGASVLTDKSEELLAESMRTTDTSVGVNKIAFGTGSSNPSKSDTSLDSENYRKTIARKRRPEEVSAQTLTYRNEPNGQPLEITEIGLFDTSGNLLWRTIIDAFQKNDDVKFSTTITLRIK